MDFAVLGPLSVRGASTRIDLGAPKARAVLAVLLCRAERPVSQDALAQELWGERRPKNAAKNIQVYVHQLRRRLADPGRIVRAGSAYLLRVEPDEMDAYRFADLAAAGRSAEAAGDIRQAADLLHQALELWRGDAYADVIDTPIIAVEADRLADQRLSVLEQRIAVDLRLGRHDTLISELAPLTARHPLRERFWAQLMLALYRSGRRTDALSTYLQAREILVAETGLDPCRELQNLHQAILDQSNALDLAALPPEASPVIGIPRMLPSSAGDFTGRGTELAGIEAALAGDREPGAAAPIVAVSGRGGIGKTALAVYAAHRLRQRYPDGQLFVDLAGTRAMPGDPHEVLGRILRALGMPTDAVPGNEDERAAAYRSMLADRCVLVLIDDARDERQVERLLPGSATCGVIVTSRVQLGALAGAHRLDLGVLPDADGAAILRKIIGAQQANAEFDRLLQPCAGLPLALRIVGSLLASRPHWSIADLTALLADKPLDVLRHRDLEVRASFASSYQGLSPEAQHLFRLLGALDRPDFVPSAAAAVLDIEQGAAQVLLDDLVDARLLDVTSNGPPIRYGFHDLVRAYARERAAAEE